MRDSVEEFMLVFGREFLNNGGYYNNYYCCYLYKIV